MSCTALKPIQSWDELYLFVCRGGAAKSILRLQETLVCDGCVSFNQLPISLNQVRETSGLSIHRQQFCHQKRLQGPFPPAQQSGSPLAYKPAEALTSDWLSDQFVDFNNDRTLYETLQMQAVTAHVMSIDGCYNGAKKVRLGPVAASEGESAFRCVTNIMNERRQIAGHYAGGGGPAHHLWEASKWQPLSVHEL
jgi:hypothetical protein